MSDEQQASKEEIILKLVKRTLTDVIKDTATAPGLKHPLNDETILQLRDCLALISQREQELAEDAGRSMDMRPRYIDEPRKQDNVVVPLEQTDLMKSRKKPRD